jgi:hypothetical protein
MGEQDLTVQDFLKEPMALSDVFVRSGMFPDCKSQAQGIVKILAGRELGLTPFQSMSGIYLVNGRLALQSNVMSGLVRKSKKYDFTVVKLDDEGCVIDFYDTSDKENKVKIGTSSFGKTDAAKSGKINSETYKAYPRNMYYARALANGARWYTPDAIMGYHSYEEMQDTEPEIIPAKTTVAIDVNAEVKNGTEKA